MSFPKDTPEEHRDGVGTMCELFARPGGMGQGAKQSPVFKQNYPPKRQEIAHLPQPQVRVERKNAALDMTFVR